MARPAAPAGPAAFAEALRHHQAGRLEEAERCYGLVLAVAPRHADTLHLLGLLAGQTGRPGRAIELIRAAIAINPRAPVYHCNLGRVLSHERRQDEAVACFHRALALRPDDPETQAGLGIALAGLGRREEAIASYRRALALRPGDPETLTNLGAALHEQGRPEEGIACCRQAIAARSDFPEAHNNLGIALAGLGRREEAAASYRRALALRPDFPGALTNLGAVLVAQGRLEEGIDCHGRALALRPDFPEALGNLGSALKEQGRLDEAVASFCRALTLRPDDPDMLSNLGTALLRLRRLREAESCFRAAIGLRPEHVYAHFHLALALLALGELAEGWGEYEWRWRTPLQAEAGKRHHGARPQWTGESAAGRTLLVWAEQGLGDTLQFCRYVPLAAARGARVVVTAPKPLLRLLRSVDGVEAVLAQDEALPPFDLHCPMLSLPRALGTTLATIPAPASYLRADPERVAAWRRRLAAMARGPGIGLVWAGNPRSHIPELSAVDARRSLSPELLAPVLAVPGWHFLSLQKTGPAAPAALPLTNLMAEMEDFADTAALVATLDLVISVDTAVAHLAGALGRPVWLLDRFDACWRWLDGRRDSPWYPGLRIYRQPRPGDWESVIAEVAAALACRPVAAA
ncbi:Tetratricopeptide repeat protein [Rhodovastum atsumiense]|nr:tetratricopeptide repeat-containing glycosyltransferase family protein [Rhodovastum atsumiense]CAH2603636.1 Tetratricopeptide repeat protein [Rhodovastum atsumiense]